MGQKGNASNVCTSLRKPLLRCLWNHSVIFRLELKYVKDLKFEAVTVKSYLLKMNVSFRCLFASFSFAGNAPTTIALIPMLMSAKKQQYAKIF